MSRSPSGSDARIAKWILLATLVLVLGSKFAFGQVAIHAVGDLRTATVTQTDDATQVDDTDDAETQQDGQSDEEAAIDESSDAPQDTQAEKPKVVAIPLDELYRNVSRGTVEILIGNHLVGTGWFVGDEGLIITAAHAVPKHDARIEVNSLQCGRMEVKFVAIDLGTDVALLEAPSREGGYEGLKLAEKPQTVGDTLYMVGTPLFRHRIMQRGMASSLKACVEHYDARFVIIDYISAMAQAGTSGAAWVNRQGEAVGMQSGIMIVSSAPSGLCFSTPLASLKRIVETRKTAQTATAGLMCEELWQHGGDTIKRYPPGIEALLVKSTVKDGPAARAGVRGWDLIDEVDGQKVRFIAELVHAIRAKKPGDTIRLTLIAPDGTGKRSAEVKLGCLEVNWP